MLNGHPLMKSPAMEKLFKLLGDARFVGGAVRDSLAGRVVKDIDVATPLLPEQVSEILSAAGIKVIPTGIKHGTVTAIVEKFAIEITTLRRDEICDGRHANVTFTDNWLEDAKRRDFTINAMYMDWAGNIYDYFGGQEDLKNKIIRFIGKPEDRIKEDYLRILRFFRFACQLETQNLDQNGLIACGQHSQGLKKLSGERVQAEMLKIFSAPSPSYVLELMREQKIFPELGIENPDFNLFNKLDLREKDEKIAEYFPVDPLFRLSLLLLPAVLDIGKFAERWKLSSKAREKLGFLLQPHEFPGDEKSAKKSLRKMGKENFQNLLKIGLLKDKINLENFISLMRMAGEWRVPEFPVNGDELLKLGALPGKNIGAILNKLENWWEENNYKPDKAALLDQLKVLFPSGQGW